MRNIGAHAIQITDPVRNDGGIRERSRKLSVMNDLMDRVSTYPFLPVHTFVGCAKGEVLLTAKSNAAGSGSVEIGESGDGCSLFLRLELYQKCEGKCNRLGQGPAPCTLG